MDRLVFGMGPVALAHTRRKHRRGFAAVLSEALDAEVVVVVASTYDELAGLVGRGEIHLAWLPPAVFVRCFDRAHVRLLMSAVRGQGSRFRGVLFVRADTPWERLEDLRGSRVAWVDRASCSGYLFPRLALFEAGHDPDAYFEEQFVLGSHNAVARAVSVGKTDVGATFIDRALFHPGAAATGIQPGWALEVEPDAMKAIVVSEEIPADTLAATTSLDEGMLERIVTAMGGLHESARGAEILARMFGVDRFEQSAPADYEIVRRALATERLGR